MRVPSSSLPRLTPPEPLRRPLVQINALVGPLRCCADTAAVEALLRAVGRDGDPMAWVYALRFAPVTALSPAMVAHAARDTAASALETALGRHGMPENVLEQLVLAILVTPSGEPPERALTALWRLNHFDGVPHTPAIRTAVRRILDDTLARRAADAGERQTLGGALVEGLAVDLIASDPGASAEDLALAIAAWTGLVKDRSGNAVGMLTALLAHPAMTDALLRQAAERALEVHGAPVPWEIMDALALHVAPWSVPGMFDHVLPITVGNALALPRTPEQLERLVRTMDAHYPAQLASWLSIAPAVAVLQRLQAAWCPAAIHRGMGTPQTDGKVTLLDALSHMGSGESSAAPGIARDLAVERGPAAPVPAVPPSHVLNPRVPQRRLT